MIYFYYNAGSEQTTVKLTQSIREKIDEGKEVLLLVPEQQTVSTERRMLEILPPKAQLQFEVVNFSRLANRTFRQLGGHSWNVATPAVRALTMWRALRDLAPMLSQYGEHAKEARLCDLMLETAERCKAYGITSDELLRLAESLLPDEPLAQKLTDLGTIIGTFEQTLSQSFDNGDNELDNLVKLLATHAKALFADTYIYVDGFMDYTAQEFAVLRTLMSASPAISFTFPLAAPADGGLHLKSAARTHDRLQFAAKDLGESILMVRGEERAPQSAREYVAQHLFDMDAEPAPLGFLESPDISLTLCATPFSQAQAAVAEIHRLVREGCRYRDITVILRDANSTIGILDAALEREGIPFFLSEKTDITVRPLIKLIVLSLRLQLHGMRDEDVIAYLKTGLCGLDADDVNLFEEYTAVWHPRGSAAYQSPFSRNPDGYTMKKSERGDAILSGANRARERAIPPLLTFHRRLSEAKNGADMCRALYDFLCVLEIPAQLNVQAQKHLEAGARREAEELSRLWAVTVSAIDDVARVLGERTLSVAEFLEALKTVFARTDIGTIPTAVDEVTIGSAVTLRADHPRFVIVLGLNEGEFPANVGEDGVLSEEEKKQLKRYGLELPSGREERASNELFFLYRAFNTPKEGLFLFCTKATSDGRAATPSIAVERVCRLMNQDVKNLPTFESKPAMEQIYTPASALERLCDLPEKERTALGDYLARRGVAAAQHLDHKVTQANAALSKETASDLFENRRLSPSQLESYASCPFAYYCERVLKLREDKNATLALSDTGTFLHYVLEKAMEHEKCKPAPFKNVNSAEINALVKQITDAYLSDLVATSGALTPRAKSLTERLSTLAGLVVKALFEEFADSDFRPAFTELNLKQTGSSCDLVLDDGRRIALTGTADRVDVWKAPDQKAYLRVLDYKTGTREFSVEDIKHGSSLQMPLYLKALTSRAYPILNNEMGLPPDTVLIPAGVTYFSTAVKSENTPSRQDEQTAMQEAAGRLSRSGVLLNDLDLLTAASHSENEEIVGTRKGKKHLDSVEFDAMFRDLSETVARLDSEMKRGVAAACPNPEKKTSPCEYCKFNAICRTGGSSKKGESHGA